MQRFLWISGLLLCRRFLQHVIKAAPKTSEKKDHLRVDVTGDVEGDTLNVSSIELL